MAPFTSPSAALVKARMLHKTSRRNSAQTHPANNRGEEVGGGNAWHVLHLVSEETVCNSSTKTKAPASLTMDAQRQDETGKCSRGHQRQVSIVCLWLFS